MRVGTPGFIGSRLTEAREARGLSQTSLAQLIDVKVTSVSQYEHGKQSPSPEVMETICDKLNFDLRFFLRPSIEHQRNCINYRSMHSATKAARIKAERRFEWLKETVWYLREYLDMPNLNIPAFTLPEPEQITNEQIEEAAEQCRLFWQLGFDVIEDVVLILENNGVVVTRTALEAETLDAFSQWCVQDSTPYIVLGADKGSASRSRFDAAHELGHLILHRNVEARKINNSVIHRIMEQQAHRFAAAFLLPAKSFANEIWSPTLDGFAVMKKYWKVSIGTMISRCEQLEIFNEEQARRCWINMGRRGWRVKEPLDDQLPPEEPRLVKRSIQMLIDEGIKTREQIISELRLPAADIEDLAGLPRGYFNGLEVIRQVEPRLKRSEEIRAISGVLSFPKH
jgi:Zn-dependent peptidase ImmA (M78 family)/DNA-binding XRE family transcriptional regulator